MKRKIGPKYVIMNGSCGCMPDNYMYAESFENALHQINELFGSLPRGAISELRYNRIYYFGKHAYEYGADYVEIADNTETTYADIEAAEGRKV